MDIAAFVVSCLAVVCAAGAVWYARGQKHAADRAATAAEKAASTAIAAEERQQRAEERSRVLWSLTNVNKSKYVLAHEGTDPAYGVHVDAGELLTRGPTEFDRFPPGHSESYLLSRAFGMSTDRIIVTWHHSQDLSDDQRRQELLI